MESADETTREYLSGLHERYRRELLGSVVPFWMRHALDPSGGINTCIADDGRVLSRDRFLWSQLRAIWTFSALYNRIERRSEWLDAARGIFEFCLAHGRDAEGRWVFRLSPEGAILEGPTSIYADGFAIIGLSEFARATDDERAYRAAIETFEEVERRLELPGSYGTAPYAVPEGAKAHGISMIFSHAFFELAELLDDEVVMDSAIAHHREVMDCFLRREDGLVREFVGLDGSLIDSPQGRAVVPGHAVESMWFQMHIMHKGGEARDIARVCECIRRHVELAWDGEFGGLVLARDAKGAEPWWPYADTKLWWPHTEALYALLLAYEFTRADWALEWLRKVDEYAFAHYPVKEHGEWTQRLDRQGRRLDAVVALPVKDPFHLPRSLVMCLEVLERLMEDSSQ